MQMESVYKCVCYTELHASTNVVIIRFLFQTAPTLLHVSDANILVPRLM